MINWLVVYTAKQNSHNNTTTQYNSTQKEGKRRIKQRVIMAFVGSILEQNRVNPSINCISSIKGRYHYRYISKFI